MGKVILVLDGMPKDCSCCPAHFLDIPNNTHHQWWCGAILKTLENKKRPDWCPLVELPEKLEGNDSVYYQCGDYEDGWNACIDDMITE